ncbi:MAG: PglZ domain-containing protein [Methanosarcinales archaeon]|nr:PglZ domain-containing protein [Methanosarcinales archaeon]
MQLSNDKLTNLNITNIIVTSDHGFIYKREHLESVHKRETQDFNKS